MSSLGAGPRPGLQQSPQQQSPQQSRQQSPQQSPQPDPRPDAQSRQQLSPEMALALATLMGKLEAANITSVTREVALQCLHENAGNVGKALNWLKRNAALPV